MNIGLLSVRYATSLFDFAKSNNEADKVYEEVKIILHILSEVRELKDTLQNPILSKKEKKGLILNIFDGKSTNSLKRFIDLLLENSRENQIQTIFLKYIDLYRQEKNIFYGKLTTATPIDKETEKNIVNLVLKKLGGTIELEKKIDPSILGGFLLQVDDIRWDGSVLGQLNQIRNRYMEYNKKII